VTPLRPAIPAASPRRRRLSLLGVIATLLLIASGGACSFADVPGLGLPSAPLDTTTPRPPQSVQRWLDTNSVTVRSIRFDDTAFSDLAPLRDAIGSARVVMLGEQSGFDGTTFEAKARLVRYLHEQLGFDVLVFESGLFEMESAWRRIEAGADASTAALASVSARWRHSAELQPLFAYLETRARSARPLRLAGISPEFTGPSEEGERVSFADELEGYLARHGSPVLGAPWWPAFRAAIHAVATRADDDPAPEAAERAAIAAGLPPLRADLNRLVNVAPADEAGLWITAMWALETHLRLLVEPLTPEQRTGVRDSSMTESLLWLALARYPDRRLIVWTSSAASIRSPRELFTPSGAPVGHERAVFGTLARAMLGDVIYSVGFLAGSGRYGPVLPTSTAPLRPLVPPLPESWDGLFLATGKPYAFLHLRRATIEPDAAWLLAPRVARAVDYQQALARWPNVYDGFFFTATMAPPTLRSAGQRRLPVQSATSPH